MLPHRSSPELAAGLQTRAAICLGQVQPLLDDLLLVSLSRALGPAEVLLLLLLNVLLLLLRDVASDAQVEPLVVRAGEVEPVVEREVETASVVVQEGRAGGGREEAGVLLLLMLLHRANTANARPAASVEDAGGSEAGRGGVIAHGDGGGLHHVGGTADQAHPDNQNS